MTPQEKLDRSLAKFWDKDRGWFVLGYKVDLVEPSLTHPPDVTLTLDKSDPLFITLVWERVPSTPHV